MAVSDERGTPVQVIDMHMLPLSRRSENMMNDGEARIG